MADTGLHLHALVVFLRFVLLLLLAVILRGGLTFLQRLFQVLCRLVGLTLVVHRHLRAAFVGRGDLLGVVGVRFVAVRAALLRVELDIHRVMEALLVGHVLQLHGFARHIVGFLDVYKRQNLNDSGKEKFSKISNETDFPAVVRTKNAKA